LAQPTNQTEDEETAALRRQEYAGESLRELGVLILLFLPLETVLQKSPFWLEVSSVALLIGAALVIYGIRLQTEAVVELEGIKVRGKV
jgi:hypothetical protein